MLLYTLRRGSTVYSLSIGDDALSDEFDPAAPHEARYPRALEPKDVIFFQKDTFAPKTSATEGDGDGDGPTTSSIVAEIVDLDWERWGGDRLAITFRIRSESGASSKNEIALYSVTQDNRFGHQSMRMAFALLGKVATQEQPGGGKARPILASFAAVPHALRALSRPGMAEHACLDALLGVLWGDDEDAGGGGGDEGVSLGAAAVTWTPLIFRDPAAGAAPSAAAAVGRAAAASHALSQTGGGS